MSAKLTRTPEGDAKFFATLENGHSVKAACEAADYVRSCVYEWRKQDSEFSERWENAVNIGSDLLEEEADRRGRDGYDEPVYFQGAVAGVKRKYSDALLLARLKALRPEQYRERITVASVSNQQNVTFLVRDFEVEALMQRLVNEQKLSPSDVPARIRARLTKDVDQE